ncbi:MAG: M23 family metallopeptidase [Deltaproteobacteria bacterium]|nr:M23 family metallopeptidase [Deltaproteobacteria bacterium]
MRRPVGVLEVFGLRPLGPALRQSWTAIAGDGTSPPSQFGLSSVKMFRPLRVSLPLWVGRERSDGRVWIYNLFNRRPIPRHEGYSVKITTCRDFRGGQLTYDGHVGTDFAVPVGTEVCTIAAGIVRSVQCDMQRGGLKVVVDHGGGLISTSNHLARALVSVGDWIERGGVLGLSGMSSVDGVLFFPWLAPHLHLNVLLNGEAVDPFAKQGEVALWRTGNDPRPADGSTEPLEPTRWDPAAVEAGIAACNDPELRAELLGAGDLGARACALTVARLFRYHAFDEHPLLVANPHPRVPVLDLPFRDHTGVAFADE